MQLRTATNADIDAVVELIDGIYSEYGFKICLEDAEADLTDIEANFPEGSFMVLCDDAGRVRATVALVADAERDGVAWLKRLYLASDLQGTGAAAELLAWAEARARDLGCMRVNLWSDVLFERAHAFYRKHGYVHDGTVRHMTDAHEPYDERFFCKELTD